MHSTVSYIKHIFAFQKGLQIQLHKDSLWKRQQLLISEQMSSFPVDCNFIVQFVFTAAKIAQQDKRLTLLCNTPVR